jgi:hypothetical protein
MTADIVGYRKDARRYSMSTWLGVKLALVVGVPAFERLFARQDLKGQPVTEELKETIQAFRAMGAEIELRPILDYLASRALRESESGNIPAARRQVMKTGVAYEANFGARMLSRSATNASRFL